MAFTKENAAEYGRRGGQTPMRRDRKSDPILADLRWVWRHADEERDTTPGRRRARAVLKESPSKFLAIYRGLKRDDRAAASMAEEVPSDAQPSAPATDQGLERCLELSDEWLQEHRNVSLDEVLRACAEEPGGQPALAGNAVRPSPGGSVDPGRHERVGAA